MATLWRRPETRSKLLDNVKRMNADLGFRKKQRDAVVRMWADPVLRNRLSKVRRELAIKNRTLHSARMKRTLSRPGFLEAQAKRSRLAMIKNWANPEWRAKVSLASKIRMRKPENRKRAAMVVIETNRKMYLNSPTSLERKLYSALDAHHIKYIPQHVIEKARTTVDAFLVDYGLAVYSDGEYWHRIEKGRRRDSRVNRRLSALGIPRCRIKEDNFEGGFARLLRRISK